MTIKEFRKEIDRLLDDAESNYQTRRQQDQSASTWWARRDTLQEIKRLATHLEN